MLVVALYDLALDKKTLDNHQVIEAKDGYSESPQPAAGLLAAALAGWHLIHLLLSARSLRRSAGSSTTAGAYLTPG